MRHAYGASEGSVYIWGTRMLHAPVGQAPVDKMTRMAGVSTGTRIFLPDENKKGLVIIASWNFPRNSCGSPDRLSRRNSTISTSSLC